MNASATLRAGFVCACKHVSLPSIFCPTWVSSSWLLNVFCCCGLSAARFGLLVLQGHSSAPHCYAQLLSGWMRTDAHRGDFLSSSLSLLRKIDPFP